MSKHNNIIYVCRGFLHNSRFIVIRKYYDTWIEVKLLDYPEFISNSSVPIGHAVIGHKRACAGNIVEDNRDIMDHLKSVILDRRRSAILSDH